MDNGTPQKTLEYFYQLTNRTCQISLEWLGTFWRGHYVASGEGRGEPVGVEVQIVKIPLYLQQSSENCYTAALRHNIIDLVSYAGLVRILRWDGIVHSSTVLSNKEPRPIYGLESIYLDNPCQNCTVQLWRHRNTSGLSRRRTFIKNSFLLILTHQTWALRCQIITEPRHTTCTCRLKRRL